MVNLDLYRVFYTVAKNGSLTKAAEELYISQPAVSQSVKQLENQLGVTLFNRTHRGMELSEEGGKRIIAKVERALGLLEDAEAEVSGATARRGVEIRLCAGAEEFRYILADKIAAFSKKYPEVRLKMLHLNSETAKEWLKDGKIDAIFSERSFCSEENVASYPSGIVLERAYLGDKKLAERLRNAAANSPKHRNAAERENSSDGLQEKKNAKPGMRSGGKKTNASVCAGRLPLIALEGEDESAPISGGTVETAKELAAAGVGAVLLPLKYAERELAEGKLFVLPMTPPENSERTLYVAVNPKSEKEKLVSAFLSVAGMNRPRGE